MHLDITVDEDAEQVNIIYDHSVCLTVVYDDLLNLRYIGFQKIEDDEVADRIKALARALILN